MSTVTDTWTTLDELSVPSETWHRNAERCRNGEEACRSAGKPMKPEHFWASYTTRNFLIPADIVNEYPTEGDPIPDRFAALVEEYGPGLGMWPVGSDCAKQMAGYVVNSR